MIKSKLKRIVLFTIVFIVVIFSSLAIHTLLAEKNQWPIEFNLHSVYYFFGFAALVTYYLIEIAIIYVPEKVAYVFLISIMLKLGFFMIFFLSDNIELETTSMASRLAIVIPLFLFLFLEGLSIVLINKEIEKQR